MPSNLLTSTVVVFSKSLSVVDLRAFSQLLENFEIDSEYGNGGKFLHRPACHWLVHWRSVEREAPAYETAAGNGGL